MSIRKVVDYSVTGVFGAWLVATLLCQHPAGNLDRVRRLDDFVGNTLFPNWKFFAPNPAVEDVRILYRFASEDKGEHTEWIECDTISPRKLRQAFWFPKRRMEKSVFDVHQTIVQWAGQLNPEIISQSRLDPRVVDAMDMVNQYVRVSANPPAGSYWQQVMLVRFAGNDPGAEPKFDVVFDYVPLFKDVPGGSE